MNINYYLSFPWDVSDLHFTAVRAVKSCCSTPLRVLEKSTSPLSKGNFINCFSTCRTSKRRLFKMQTSDLIGKFVCVEFGMTFDFHVTNIFGARCGEPQKRIACARTVANTRSVSDLCTIHAQLSEVYYSHSLPSCTDFFAACGRCIPATPRRMHPRRAMVRNSCPLLDAVAPL